MITSDIVSNGRLIRRIAFYGLFFVIACLQGYRLGTGDLDTYLPFAYHEYDSSLFKNDLLMETIGVHPVYIWKAMGSLIHLIPAPTLFLLAFFCQILMIMTGLILFYREFFGNDKGIFLVLSMMSISKAAAAMGRYGLNPYGYFQPGALAFGVLLLVIVLWNRKKWITGGIIGGLMFLFHPFTAITMGLTYLAVIAFQWKTVHFKKSIIGAVVMFVAASPALIPYFYHFLLNMNGPAFDIGAWLEIVRWRMKHSFFISQWVLDRYAHLIIALALIVSFYRHRSFKGVIPVVIATLLSILLMAAGELFSSKTILQLQLARNSFLIIVMAIMFVAHRAANIDFSRFRISDALYFIAVLFLTLYSYVDENKKALSSIILTVSVFLIPVLTYIIFAFGKRLIKPDLPKLFSSAFVVTVTVLVTVIATSCTVHKRVSNDGAFFDTTLSDFTDIAFWVRDNIQKDEMVMSPVYMEGFRGFSLHPIYGTIKDGAPHNYCETTVFKWQAKMEQFGIVPSVDIALYPQIYHERAFDIAAKEGINYVVYDKSLIKNNPGVVIFENGRFAVSKIR